MIGLGAEGNVNCDLLKISMVERDGFERRSDPYDVEAVESEDHFFQFRSSRKVD